MAARKRKHNETFKAYRKNLINEEKILQVRLGGRWAYKCSDHPKNTVWARHITGRVCYEPFKY